MANEGVVVPFILEDGIGTCIPLNPLLEVGKGDVFNPLLEVGKGDV